MRRFAVLDALRCVLAMCVALGHAGLMPVFGPVGQDNGVLDLLARAWRTFAFGPPAVIAFFVISGFCIHYPFAERRENSPLGRFYARRYLRILAPAICTVALFKLLDPRAVVIGEGSILFHSTLWSIACEEIYYAAYPLLNRAGRAVGWGRLVLAAIIPMAALAWYYFPALDWNALGILPTALTLFPVWLAGCYLAEQVSSDKTVSTWRTIWCWRAAAWLVMWTALMLHFRTAIHQTLSGPFVGVFCYFWIREELRFCRVHEPWPLLVWGGRWSYSLYLIHPVVVILAARLAPDALNSPFEWLVVFGAILIASYLFYLTVERPSHRLARRIPLFPGEVAPAAAAGSTQSI